MSTMTTETKATLEEVMTSAILEAAVEAVGRVRAQISTVLAAGEECVDWHRAKKRLPFLIRVMPFMPDLMTRPKNYLIVLTHSRLVIVRMTNPLNKLKDPEVKRIEASIPWTQVEGIEPRRHMGSSSLILRTASNGTHRFKYMESEAAEKFATDARLLTKAATGS